MTTSQRLRSLIPPLTLLGACLAAYGLLAPWLGLYWDDWPKTLFYETLGAGAFTRVASHRPLNGWWYAVLLKLFGVRPLFWQATAIFWHWTSALAAWALLRQLWPQRRNLALGTALLLALYPGFSQSSISLTYFIHFLAYTLFFLSLLLTVKAAQSPARGLWWQLAALVLSGITMLTTDYYYGLELVRPLVIWLALQPRSLDLRTRLWSTAKQAAPYLLLVAALFVWRSQVQTNSSYEVVVLEQIQSGNALELFGTILGDLWQAAALAWLEPLDFLRRFQWRSLVDIGSLVLAAIGALGFLALLWLNRARVAGRQPWAERAEPLALGLVALALAGIPSWAAGLAINLGFPGDRLMLPLAFGACLLASGLILAIPLRRWLQLGLLAALAASALYFQVQTANVFREDGNRHADFWQQVTWRLPGLRPGTTILSDELPLRYYSDDSLSGILNLVFPYDDHVNGLPYLMVYIDLRMGGVLPSLETGEEILRPYRYFDFNGSTDQALVIYYQPPACLRVLDPGLDAHFTELSDDLQAALPRSSFPQIVVEPEQPSRLPEQLHPLEGEDRWCYYYQRADLARQLKDWETIKDLAPDAFALEDDPNHPAEYIPFIEAYAQTGDWVPAFELSRKVLDILPTMQPMLCDTWQRVQSEETGASGEAEALEQANREFECGIAIP